MNCLDFDAILNVASFLDFETFRAFVRTCRAFAACRHDPRTLATVALNTDKKHPERLVFSRFGTTAIRFFADKCAQDVSSACREALRVAIRYNTHRALSVLAPLCDRAVVQEALCGRYVASPFVFEALNYLDFPPDFFETLRSEVMEFSGFFLDIADFDAVRRFDRAGEIPTDIGDFMRLAYEVMISGHIGWLEQIVSALEETDASGSLKVENVDCVVALFETGDDLGIINFFEIIDEEDSYICEAYAHFRPYTNLFARLFAIAPRPLTLSQNFDMLKVFFVGGDFERVQALYSGSDQEAELVHGYGCNASYCCNAPDCDYKAQQRRLQLMVFTRLSAPSHSMLIVKRSPYALS